ncbi:primase-helicase family protein [Bradyrhizobium sp. URHD0069]|uniref:primase-helicase family protein n=1 Tax=Bradyrhizobium sp. URHD0069 TaxID=1380355 RepID=UPI0009DEF048|nr:primase-helicase family protein [Bradyrhizobium sp. URHD0069]
MSENEFSTASSDNDAAIEFLQQFEPSGPWVLTAIRPDRKGTETRTFYPSALDALTEWLNSRNGNLNIYFHVNHPIRDLMKKAEREDIKEVRWLHVDIDPRVGEPLAEEQQRLLSLLTDKIPPGIPKPTAIIFSGGGYQGFWQLKEPIQIDGNLELAENAARYNLALEKAFQADHCHNIDRIMRLPGTVNIPDERKKRKGRQPSQARLIEFDAARSYPVNAFSQAPSARGDQTAALGRPGQTSGSVKISGNIPRIADLSELDEWGVSDRLKVIIAQGRHPDETKPDDNSRSAWLFDAVCNLVRYKVPDDIIFSLLRDNAWAISESILDKGGNADKYAIRQIERAKEEAISPELRQLNESHFVIENDGGRCRVAEWVPSEGDGREQLTSQSFEDFRNRFMHIQVCLGATAQGAPVTKPLGEYWLRNPQRRQFRGLVFRPGRERVINGFLNLWRGFGVEPAQGDWSLMQKHIESVLAASDPVCADYITKWAAWGLQHPDQPAEVALVFRGGQGTGKSTFGRAMAKLFGQHGLQVTAPGQFAGRFNAHLRDVCLLFADEAVRPDDKSARGILKALLTEKNLPMEGKGRDIIQMSNYAKVIMASNDDWVVPADIDDRRFAVFAVAEDRKQDEPYFAALNNEMENGGLAAMLHDLLSMDLGDWHPRRGIPQTKERDIQKAASLAGFEALFLDMLREGETIVHHWVNNDEPFVATSELTDYAQKRLRREDMTFNKVSSLFRKLGFKKDDRARPRGFVLPALGPAREAWDRAFAKVAWDDAQDWASIEPSRPKDAPF